MTVTPLKPVPTGLSGNKTTHTLVVCNVLEGMDEADIPTLPNTAFRTHTVSFDRPSHVSAPAVQIIEEAENSTGRTAYVSVEQGSVTDLCRILFASILRFLRGPLAA